MGLYPDQYCRIILLQFFFVILQKYHSFTGGLLYGLFIGFWLTTGEYLSSYASSEVISLTMVTEWIVLAIVQYIISGGILGLL
jgi:hypothetical protein